MIRKILYLNVLLLISVSASAGGGWTHKQRSGYFKISQWWVLSNKHYTDLGKIDPNITGGIFNTSIYGEYGFTDRLNGIIYFPFFSRALRYNLYSGTTGDIILPGQAINSIGDTDIGIKYGIIRDKKLVLSGTITLGLPLGNPSGGYDGTLQTGDGEFNQMISFDLSTSVTVGKINTYYTTYVGFNNRTKGFSDEFRYGVEAGATFFNKLTTIFKLYGVKSLQNGTSNVDNATSIFSNNAEFTALSVEVAFDITNKVGLSASITAPFAGKLIYAGNAYSVGVYMKL
jgi:hypothetical protein